MTTPQVLAPPSPRHRRDETSLPRDVLALGRPRFWLLSLAPYGLGVVLAAHALVPPAAQLPRALLGAVVVGPLVWLAVLAMNDLADLPGDRLNPRKLHAPAVTGKVRPRQLRLLAWVAAPLAFATALAVSPLFAIGTAGILALGWAYSMPPLRLKERLFADIAVNAVALGLLAPLGGWTVLRPVTDFPWLAAPLGVLTVAALYVPTLVIDHPSDLAAGYRTTAVRLGEERTRVLGIVLWAMSASVSVLLCAFDMVFPQRLLPVQCVVAVTLTAAYAALTRRPSFTRLEVFSTLLAAGNLVFIASYVR